MDQGEFVAFMGPSGSGKTTLLNLLGGLDVPTHGSITVAGDEITHMSGSKLTEWRARHVGFIFQMYNLIPVSDGVSECGTSAAVDEAFEGGAKKACGDGSIGGRPWRPDESLSAATFRRAGAARGDLRARLWPIRRSCCATSRRAIWTARARMKSWGFSRDFRRSTRKTILMVTHDPLAAERAQATLQLNKGVLVEGIATTAGSLA